jgi:hypothetical protein
MNEQAIKDSYELFKSGGYSKSIDDFKSLIASNPQALNDSYELFKTGGYSKDLDSYKVLMGLTAQPVAEQPDKKKVATALPSAASSSESVSTRPTEPTIATRKPQTTSFGTYGISQPQSPSAIFKKSVAPEPESILGPVEKDMSVSREVSMRPTQPAMPKPAAPEPTSEANDYFTKSLDFIKSDFVGLAEGEVVPKLNYTFGQYGFEFNEAGPMFDEVEVIAPDGKTKETFSLDNWFTDTDISEAARLRKFISDNRPKSELLNAREGQYTKPILEDNQIKEIVSSLNADTEKLNKDFLEFKRLSDELEAKVGSVESMTPQQKEQFIQASNILEAKRLDIIRREQQINSRDKSLEAEIGKYVAMKGESGNAFTATRDAFYGIIDNIWVSAMRGISVAQDYVGLGSPVNTANLMALEFIPEAREPLRARYASKTYREYRENLPWLGNAALGLAESAPAMIPGAGLGLSILQYSGQNYEELDKSKLSNGEKTVYATALAIPSAILSKVGFENAVSEKLLGELLLKRALPRIGVNFTLPQVTKIIENDVKNLMAKGLLRIGVAGAAEFESGALEEVIDIGGKELINSLEEKEIFKTPETFLEGVKQVTEAGAAEAVGGAIIGTISAGAKGYQENKFENLLDDQVALLHQISSDPILIDAYKVKIKQAVADGKITAEEGQSQEQSFDKMVGQLRSIPDGISPAGQKEALRLIKERDDLQTKIDASDPDLVTKEKARVAEIKEKLGKISEQYPKKEEAAVETPATKEEAAVEVTSKNRIFDNIKNEDIKSELNELKKEHESAIDYYESELSDRQSEFDKKSPASRFFLKPPIIDEGAESEKKSLELLNKNPEKYLEEKISDSEKFFKDENESDAKRIENESDADIKKGLEETFQSNKEYRASRIDYLKNLLTRVKEDYAVQESSTAEGVLRNEESQMGLQEMGEGNAEGQAAPQETIVQEEVTAEPLDQKSNRLLDAIDTARQAGADGIDALNSALANLRGIASERVKQIGNRIDDLQQKVRDLTKSSAVPSATLSDLAGTQVNYNGESGTLNISEGGAVTFETPNQVIEIENATPTSLAADFKIEAPKPALEINPATDRFIDNDNVVINDVEYGIQADENGNVVGLQLKDGSNQVLTNPQLLVKAEAIRNTEGKVSTAVETTITPEAQSQIDALNGQIDALTNERSRIEQATAEPVAAEATPTEKRFAGSVLGATRVVAEDLGKLVTILTKANRNVKVITDKQAMIDFLVSKGITPEQAAQVKGFRFGDKVYINPDLATVDTPIHEFAHIWGDLCKKQRPELWKRGISLITKSNYYKDLLARIKADPELSKLYATPEAIKEEALIQAIGERGAVIFDDNKLQLLWNNWVAAFDNFVKKLLGLPMNTDITKIKLSEFLDMAATEVLTGKGTGVGGEMTIEKTKAAKNIEAQVEAWHGSPYRFDKFSLSKMGTGEGAQAFGWGLYFTDLESIARSYKSKLSQKENYELWLRDTTVENKIEELYEDLDRATISKYEFINNKISFLEELLRTWDYNKAIDEVNANPSVVKWADIHVKPFVENDLGTLYKVSLHEGKTPDQYTWLEWDKKVSKDLTIKLTNAINNSLNLTSSEKEALLPINSFDSASDLYRRLSDFIGQKEASLLLLENGIDGVKYPAESISSGATSDTARGFNYVVFDENAVKIQEAIQFQAQQSANDLAKIINDAIKAKLTKAQIVDILVKRGGLTSADANQAYNDVKAKQPISIATTGTTPAATTTTVKPKTKFVDGIVNAIEQMLGGNMSPEVKDAITTSINKGREAVRTAQITEREMKKQLVDMLKDLARKGTFTQKEILPMMRRIAGLNVFNDSAVDNFVNFVVNKFEASETKAKDREVRSKIKNARKNLKSKVGVAKDAMPTLRRLFSLNPRIIPPSVRDAYNELVIEFGERAAVLSLDNINDVMVKADNILQAAINEQNQALLLKNAFDSFQNKVLDANGNVDYAKTIKQMIDDGVITTDEADIMTRQKKLIFESVSRKKTEAEIEAERVANIDTARNMSTDPSDIQTRDERNDAEEFIELINTDAVNNLTPSQAAMLPLILDNINNGWFPSAGKALIASMNGANAGNELADVIMNKAKAGYIKKALSSVRAMFRKETSAIIEFTRGKTLQYIDRALGIKDSRPIYNLVLKPIAEAYSVYKASYDTIERRIDKARDNVLKSFRRNGNKLVESSYKQMAYMLQREYLSNKGMKGVVPVVEIIDATIQKLKKDNRYADAKTLEQIKKDYVVNGEFDNDKLYNSFNAAEKKCIDVLSEINEELTDKAVYTASVIRGDASPMYLNYVHHDVLIDANNPMQNYNSVTSAHNPSTRAASLIARTGGAKPLNFDAFSAVKRSSRNVLLDYNMTQTMRTVNKTLSTMSDKVNSDPNVTKDQEQIAAAIEKNAKEVVEDVFMGAYNESTLIDDTINYITKSGYRSMLAGVRSAAELITNFGAAMYNPKAFFKGVGIVRTSTDFNPVDVMMNVKSSEIQRLYSSDPLTGKFVDPSSNTKAGAKSEGKTNKVFNKINQIRDYTTRPVRNKIESLADVLISAPDKVVMRPHWFGTFASEFKKVTGVEPDFDKIAANDEAYMKQYKDAMDNARDRADKMSVFIGASDNPFKGILKNTVRESDKGYIKTYKRFNAFMTRFLVFEYATARAAVTSLVGRGELSKGEGAALLGAITLRMIGYQFLYSILSEQFQSLIIEAFGGAPPEEDEKDVEEKLTQSTLSAFANLVIGRDLGNASKSILNYGVEQFNEAYLEDLRNGREYDKFKDNIVYSPIPLEMGKEGEGKKYGLDDVMISLSGPLSPLMKTAQKGLDLLGQEERKEFYSRERQIRNIEERMPLEILGHLGFVPFYKDLRGALIKDINKTLDLDMDKIKAKRKKEKEQLKKEDPWLYESIYGEEEREEKIEKQRIKKEKEREKKEEEKLNKFYGGV